MKIKVKAMLGAKVMMCSTNVKKQIRACGGKKAFGWKIIEIGDNWKVRENHCVWEDPDGVLWDVTPEFAEVPGENAVCKWDEEIEFERDDSSAFVGKSHPNQYIPPNDNRHLKSAAEYLGFGDRAVHEGDFERCRYWTNKANAAMRKGGSPARWEVPQSCDLADTVKTMTIPPCADLASTGKEAS